MNKVALITGGAKRTGKALVEFFAARKYDVVVHFGTSAEEANLTVEAMRQSGRRAIAVRADLADERQVERLLDRTYEAFGQLDLLINNASVFGQDHFADFSVPDLDRSLAINFRAPILLTRAFHRRAAAHNATGVVINVVDQKVKGNFHPDHFSYTAGKAGIGNMTAMLAVSAAPVLRVNAVFPGLMLASDDQSEADFEHASRHATPLGLVATPLDLAQAIELLSGSAYNGFDMIIDGGQNLKRVSQDVLYAHRAPQERSGQA